jgi:hypothetical protein
MEPVALIAVLQQASYWASSVTLVRCVFIVLQKNPLSQDGVETIGEVYGVLNSYVLTLYNYVQTTCQE